MRKLSLLVAILIVMVATLIANSGFLAEEKKTIDWKYDLPKALEDAKKANKPVMVDFYADWCPPCRKMSEETFTNARVVELAKKFICVKVDVDKSPDLAEKYGIEAIPTIMFFNSKGEKKHSIVGFRDADGFVKVMNEALKKTK